MFIEVRCEDCKHKLVEISHDLYGVIKVWCRHCKKDRIVSPSIVLKEQRQVESLNMPCYECGSVAFECVYCQNSISIDKLVDVFHVGKCKQCGNMDDEPCPKRTDPSDGFGEISLNDAVRQERANRNHFPFAKITFKQ